jgi:hypothetical protein
MPGPVRAARVALFIGAALTVLTVFGYLLVMGGGSEAVGRAIWVSVPGVIAFMVALRMPRGGKRLFWWAVGACGLWIVGALGSIGRGDPRGLTQLVIPVLVLVLLTRSSARRFFRGWT